MKSKAGKGKYANELERLRELSAIKEVLKKGDIENAALTNTSKDSEIVSDSTIDNMLNQLQIDKNSNKDLEIIESLTATSKRNNILNDLRTRQKKKPIQSNSGKKSKSAMPKRKKR